MPCSLHTDKKLQICVKTGSLHARTLLSAPTSSTTSVVWSSFFWLLILHLSVGSKSLVQPYLGSLPVPLGNVTAEYFEMTSDFFPWLAVILLGTNS